MKRRFVKLVWKDADKQSMSVYIYMIRTHQIAREKRLQTIKEMPRLTWLSTESMKPSGVAAGPSLT